MIDMAVKLFAFTTLLVVATCYLLKGLYTPGAINAFAVLICLYDALLNYRHKKAKRKEYIEGLD